MGFATEALSCQPSALSDPVGPLGCPILPAPLREGGEFDFLCGSNLFRPFGAFSPFHYLTHSLRYSTALREGCGLQSFAPSELTG